jgi:acyl-CoA synthetase (AMP-forming)/AMP-acid ligase II
MLKPHQHAEKFDTVGTPVIGFEVRILDDAGRELPAGEAGEIAGYGAGMMRAYHNRAEQTAELIWRDARGRTFIRSGDIGMLDADGFLRIVDRKKDMIISGGFNVFPADVEAIVGEHPDVSDVTVIGVPHPKWGESCLALVIPAASSTSTAEAIRDWANARLAKTQRLVGVEFREAFPRNALGKVIKKDLRADYWRNAVP